MSVTIRIPTPMRRHTGEQSEVQAQGATVGEALRDFASQHQEAGAMLFNKAGEVNRFVNVYVNDEVIFSNSGGEMPRVNLLDTPLQNGDEVLLLPAAVGGRQ